MHLSSVIVFAAFVLWASASDSINEYNSQWNNSVLRRGNPMPVYQKDNSAASEQLSAYNAYVFWNHDSNGNHHIYVTEFDGIPVRTYTVRSDEQHFRVVNYFRRHSSDTIMHQNRDGKQETYVLKPNGLRTYVVNINDRFLESNDHNAHTIKYYHTGPNGETFSREIGHGGCPVRTVIEYPNGTTSTITLNLEGSGTNERPLVRNAFWRRGNHMEGRPSQSQLYLFQAGTGQLSWYNAYLSWSWHREKYHIYVTSLDGKPVRTFIVDADEKHYIVFNYSRQPTRYTVMSQNPSVRHVTKVLGPNGVRTYAVEIDKSTSSREDPAEHYIQHSHGIPDGKKFLRWIGSGGQPLRTIVRINEYGHKVDYDPIERPIVAADHE